MTEAEIRNSLIKRLSKTSEGADAAFISEMFVNGFSRRADLIMANGKLSVFEIKSDRDTLVRLQGQIETYTNFFEQVTIVCADKHIQNVAAMTGPDIGVWSIDTQNRISVIRYAKYKSLPSVINWLSFLPVDELRIFLRQQGIKAIGSREQLVHAAAKKSARVIRAFVLNYLKRRDQRIFQLKDKLKKQNNISIENTIDINQKMLSEYLKTIEISAKAMPRILSHSSNSSSSVSISPLAIRSE